MLLIILLLYTIYTTTTHSVWVGEMKRLWGFQFWNKCAHKPNCSKCPHLTTRSHNTSRSWCPFPARVYRLSKSYSPIKERLFWFSASWIYMANESYAFSHEWLDKRESQGHNNTSLHTHHMAHGEHKGNVIACICWQPWDQQQREGRGFRRWTRAFIGCLATCCNLFLCCVWRCVFLWYDFLAVC